MIKNIYVPMILTTLLMSGCGASSPKVESKPSLKTKQTIQKKQTQAPIIIQTPKQKFKTTKTSCVLQSEYKSKNQEELKKILHKKAKAEALDELYGVMMRTNLELKNGEITKDEIQQLSLGSIRIKGKPTYFNGKNWGEICTTIDAYITKEDFAKYRPQDVKLVDFCYNNPAATTSKIQSNADYAAYKKAISKFKPSMKNISDEKAESYIHGYSKSNEDFDFDTGVYCFDAVVRLMPYEFELIHTPTTKFSNVVTQDKQTTYSDDNGLSVTFFNNGDINKKKPIYKTKITKDFSLFNTSFVNNTIKKDKPYYIHISGYLDSSITRYANLKLDADVDNIRVLINGKKVLNKHELKAGVALKAGKNSLDIFVTSSNSYDVKLLEKKANGKYTPLSLSKLYTRE